MQYLHVHYSLKLGKINEVQATRINRNPVHLIAPPGQQDINGREIADELNSFYDLKLSQP